MYYVKVFVIHSQQGAVQPHFIYHIAKRHLMKGCAELSCVPNTRSHVIIMVTISMFKNFWAKLGNWRYMTIFKLTILVNSAESSSKKWCPIMLVYRPMFIEKSLTKCGEKKLRWNGWQSTVYKCFIKFTVWEPCLKN